MSKTYPGPYANLTAPTGDDAIYASQHLAGTPDGYTTGAINKVNPKAPDGANQAAINAAAVQGGDPVNWQTSPGYTPAPSLEIACEQYVIWSKANQGPHHGDAPPHQKHNNYPTRGEAMAKANGKERAVLVTTAHRGVFFGYATQTDGETIKLRRARNCIYWPTANKGFLGLASDGPAKGSRVGPAADIELRDITCVAEVSPSAIEVWEKQPWSA